MKAGKLFMTLAIMLMCGQFAVAQNTPNDNADNIVGTYEGVQNGDRFKAKIEKMKDGTYRGQMLWVENDKDENGNKKLDEKNPDKKLRKTPIERIVIFSGLKYDEKDKRWGDCKIYDPQRGIRANLEVWFEKDGQLRLKGSKFGISESVYWKKIEN